MKRAMAEMWGFWREQQHGIEPLLQIHDEILFEVPDEKFVKLEWGEIVMRCLTETTKLVVPVKAKGGYAGNWGDLKD